MCNECLQTPCHPKCPNAPEPKAVETCFKCEGGIVPGDRYARINGVCYCESCIEDMPYCVLIPMLGGEWHEALEEDCEDECD